MPDPGLVLVESLLKAAAPSRRRQCCRGILLALSSLLISAALVLIAGRSSFAGQQHALVAALAAPQGFEPGFLQDFVSTKTANPDPRVLRAKQMPRLILETAQHDMEAVIGAVRAGFRGFDIPHRRLDRYRPGVAAALATLFQSGIPRESVFLQLQLDPTYSAELNPNKTITMQIALAIMKNFQGLGVQYVDSLVLAGPYADHSKTMEAWRAMEDAVQANLAKQLGLRSDLVTAKRVYRDAMKTKPAVLLQAASSDSMQEHDTREWCKDTGIALLSNWTQTLVTNERALDSKAMEDVAEKYSVKPPMVLFRFMVGMGAVPLVAMDSGYREYNSAWRVPLGMKDAEVVDSVLRGNREGAAEVTAREKEQREKEREKEQDMQRETDRLARERQEEEPQDKMDAWRQARDQEIRNAADSAARRVRSAADWNAPGETGPELYLPTHVQGHEVLIPEGYGKWRADNSKLMSRGPGLGYRNSPEVSDKAGKQVYLAWGEIIDGTDVGNGWVKRTVKRETAEPAKMLHLPPQQVYASLWRPDADGYVREYAYRPDGSPHIPVVDCSDWETASTEKKSTVSDEAISVLRKRGYVILENLLPKDKVQEAAQEFRRVKPTLPSGMTFGRMRGRREMTVPPFDGIWTQESLTRHPLVMKIVAKYLRNSLDSIKDEDATQQAIAEWINTGSPIDIFQEGGKYSKARGLLDLMVIVDTPAGAPAQVRHRDVIKPGPCASIGVHIPLTPLTAHPLNGAIGFTPGSHCLAEAGGAAFKRDVVGAIPQGSVIIYDDFTEHHGLENNSTEAQSALTAWYRCPALYSGQSDENFGAPGLESTMQWRRHVEEKLRPAVMEARGNPPSGAEIHPGFPLDRDLAVWGEDKVCFRCDRTTSLGSLKGDKWFCRECWHLTKDYGGPEPRGPNVEKPQLVYDDDFSEEKLRSLEAQGMNVRPSRGRHKLTLLRERGFFLPTDPTSEWLDAVPREPQPEMWKIAMRMALGREETA